MKKDLTELIFILDQSGSMSGLEKDTIGGFNSLINKQKEKQGEAIVTTVLFDNKVLTLHDRINLNDVPLLTDNEYIPNGMTALLDAIGMTIKKVVSEHKKLNDNEIPEKTMMIITTDGMENASREYNYSKVQKIIKEQKEKNNWEFIFLGANIDSVQEAAKMGIDRDNAVDYAYSSKGVSMNYDCLDNAINELRTTGSLSKEWRKNIDQEKLKEKK